MNIDSPQADRRALLRNALATVEKIQSKLDAYEQSKSEPIAIIGMSCRFPGGANSPEEYWQLLRDGVDAVTEVPTDRQHMHDYISSGENSKGRDITWYGGFIEGIDQFDPQFFGLTPREAMLMDPQQRLVLEVSWEALERAGQAPDKLKGSQTGIFIGITTNDYAQLTLSADPSQLDAYTATGGALNVTPGRVAYTLGFQGPSMAVDTACSSSLVAIHLACQSLRNGESNLALAGGVNVLLKPEAFVCFDRWGMMSSDGRCKTFDARADGFVRGEGCGVIVLKRLSDAIANGDHVLALIRGSAVNQDGRSSGLTVPNGLAQTAVIRTALANAGVQPSEVSYVETHGTGTSLGDPIEVEALGNVLIEGRSENQHLYLSSVKTNIGHLESAAGIAGLMKVVLSMQHKEIPPHLHLQERSPRIPWPAFKTIIPTEPTAWNPNNNSRLAGVSSFGFSGTNAHVVLEEAAVPEHIQPEDERPAHLLSLSTRSEQTLKQLAIQFERHLTTHPSESLADVAFTANIGRAQFPHRLALVAGSREQAINKLTVFSANQETTGIYTGEVKETDKNKIVFLFTGQGSQYVGMGRQLYETEPIFRETMDKCDELLRPYLDQSLLEIIHPENTEKGKLNLLDQTAYTQPALFALEYSLAKLWQSWGIKPTAVMGHSVGEYVAACFAGVFSLEDGIKLIAERGRLMQALPQGGKMAAIFSDLLEVSEFIKPYKDQVSIAASNGPKNTVISGVGTAIDVIIDKLNANSIQSRYLTVSHAFHSPLMDPILDEFLETANEIEYHPPEIDLISNVSGQLADDEIAKASYWQRHIRKPVLFTESIQTLHQQGYRIFLEIGPKPTLLSMGQHCISDAETNDIWLPSLRPGQEDGHQILQSLAELVVNGVDVDWFGFEHNRKKNRNRLVLPSYPFARERYWLPHNAKTVAGSIHASILHPLLHNSVISPLLKEIVYQTQINTKTLSYLDHHRLFGALVFPATGYLEIAQAAAQHTFGKEISATIKNITILEALLLSDEKDKTVQIAISPPVNNIASFQLYSLDDQEKPDWKLHATGQIEIVPNNPATVDINISDLRAQQIDEVIPDSYYHQMYQLGVEYGESFRGITAIWKDGQKALGHIKLPDGYIEEAGQYHLHPAILDACFQLLGVPLVDLHSTDSIGNIYVPVDIGNYIVYQPGCGEIWCQASLQVDQMKELAVAPETLTGQLQIFDSAGKSVAELNNIKLKLITQTSIQQISQTRMENWLHELTWKQHLINGISVREESTHWLIFADQQGVASKFVSHLKTGIDTWTLIIPGQAFSMSDTKPWQVNPTNPEDFEHLISEIIKKGKGTIPKIVYLWPIDTLNDQVSRDVDGENMFTMACGGALHLSQALVKLMGTQPNHLTNSFQGLWLVTQGAQVIDSSQKDVSVFQAPIWGFGRTLMLEYPNLHVVCVDLDPMDNQNSITLLLQETLTDSSENQVAYRNNIRFVARLESSRTKLRNHDLLEVDVQGQYLITGGLGGLGLQTARWLVNKGAQHLTILSRSAASDEAKLTLDELEQLGAQIVVIEGDVAKSKDVVRVLQRIEESGHPLKGIIHAAGVLDDALLAEQTWTRFSTVLKPKMIGAWYLHTYTKNMQIDFFVQYSAGAALLGSAGQSNYAAANAFLDGLAYYRNMQKLPALSINWGGWSQVGMAARLGSGIHRRWKKQGIQLILPEEGVQVLEKLLTQDLPQIGVFPINWTTFARQLENPASYSILTLLIQSKQSGWEVPGRDSAPKIRKQLETLSSKEKLQTLQTHIEEQLIAVMGLNPNQSLKIEQGFTEMGMDSLMAVELSRRLQRSLDCVLPATLAFEYSTLDTLTHYIAQEILKITDIVEIQDVKIDSTREAFIAQVEELSPNELEEAMLDELKRAGYLDN